MATILLIENDHILQQVLKETLSKEHQVLGAKNSDEALKLLEEHKPDLVVTDLLVPNSNGVIPALGDALGLVSQVRSRNSRTRILVYSSVCYEPIYRRKILTLGANDCLIKPVSLDTFERTIFNLLSSSP